MTASPCNRTCALDPVTGWCRGCGRTIDEIAGWSAADPGRRDAILARLPARLARMAALRIPPQGAGPDGAG